MIIHDCEQLSPEWWSLRAGVPTASDFSRIITAKDGLPSKSQQAYAEELAKDLQCQNPNYFTELGKPLNVHVQRGRNLEEEAVAWYAMTRRVDVEKVGFVTTDCKRFGCSPDSLILDRATKRYLGGVEIKCPAKDKHEANVKKGVLPLEYKAQVHGCLAVTGLPYWIFLEYCPDSTVPTLCLKVEPDAFTEALKVQLEAFWLILEAEKAKLGLVKENVVSNAEIISAWLTKLASKPDVGLLNSWLPEMADIHDMPTKRVVWADIQTYAREQAWVFKHDLKAFVVEELPV